MKQVYTQRQIPNASIILKGIDNTDYQDSYLVIVNVNDTIDNITTQIFNNGPKWSDILMKVRDFMVKALGVKTSSKPNIASFYPIGSKAVLFRVIDRNDNEIVMSEDDKHLIFRTSILKEVTNEKIHIYFNTIVEYHNGFGKFYFTIIKPFHRLIMKSCLKRYAKSIC